MIYVLDQVPEDEEGDETYRHQTTDNGNDDDIRLVQTFWRERHAELLVTLIGCKQKHGDIIFRDLCCENETRFDTFTEGWSY